MLRVVYLRVPTRKTGIQRRTLGCIMAWRMIARIVVLGMDVRCLDCSCVEDVEGEDVEGGDSSGRGED